MTSIYDRFEYTEPKRVAMLSWGDRLQEIVSGAKPIEDVVPLHERA